MKVLIVSKTHAWGASCVGGITESGVSIRLKQPDGSFPDSSLYEVGQVWELEFEVRPDHPPHLEDVLVSNGRLVETQLGLRSHLLGRIAPKQGPVAILYDGKLGYTGSGSCYVAERLGVPNYSTDFWIPDVNLRFSDNNYYWYGPYRFPYVGFVTPIPVIPAGTLVRVSLARWWAPPGIDMEQRCYLQLSGWY